MNQSQLARRNALLARQDAALHRWPQGKAPAFIEEVTMVARELEALAREVDELGADRLQRARTWRFAGLAYADAAVGQELLKLAPTARAFGNADGLLEGLEEPIERMKLDYAYGRALFRLSQGRDLSLAMQARDRLASALELARSFMPALVASAEEALDSAQKGLDLVWEGTLIDQQIADLPAGLREDYRRKVEAGLIAPTQQFVFEEAIKDIEQIARGHSPDLQVMIDNLGRIRELSPRLIPIIGATGQDLPAQSRAEAIWKRFSALKVALHQDYFRIYGADETKTAALDLYKRLDQAEILLRQHGDDDQWCHRYEHDVLRPLAFEVRTHLLRNHLTLAWPIWPSTSRAHDASSVFYSGHPRGLNLVASACERTGLSLQSPQVAINYASARWDALRSSQIAVFDFTAYSLVDVGKPVPLSTASAVAATAYELGMALTIGCPVVIIAAENQEIPFDVDITPVRLQDALGDVQLVLDALEGTVYGIQRRQRGNALPAARAYLRQRMDGERNPTLAAALSTVDESIDQNAVKLRRLTESVLGYAGESQTEIIFPTWPGSYPDNTHRLLFHVTPFRPDWASQTMEIASQACVESIVPTTYVRGDHVLEPDIIGSIWNNLCCATHILVDLTGLNPNVTLELGIAHTLGQNVMLISQDDPETFPHFAKARVHRYTLSPSNPRSLRRRLDQFPSGAL